MHMTNGKAALIREGGTVASYLDGWGPMAIMLWHDGYVTN